MEALESELKNLVVETLLLEDVSPEDIRSDEPLFFEGLGLDSIDALELATAIHRRFGVRIEANDEKNKQIFRSVRTLAAFIQQAKADPTSDAKAK